MGTERFIRKFVIPKLKFGEDEGTPIKTYVAYPNGRVDDTPIVRTFYSDDIPVWYGTSTLLNHLLEVQTSFYMPRYRKSDYWGVYSDDVSEFVVQLREHAPGDGALGEPWEGRVGKLMEVIEDGTDDNYAIMDKLTKKVSVYDRFDLKLIDVSYIKELARNVLSTILVSKQGFLPERVPEDVSKLVLSKVTGMYPGLSPQQILQILKEDLLGPAHMYNIALKKGPLPYGPKEENFLPIPKKINALNAGPLPYGPTEENFVGGKRRKSRSSIGNQMARRGTRRSRGIFSRLYSPIGHLLSAGKESVGAVTNTAKGVVGEGIHGLDKIGRSVSRHANMAVKDVFTRKGGKRRGKGSRKSRKSRRTTRRRR